MPAEDGAFSLVIALSVFTHTTQAHAEYYLREITRVMRPEGTLVAGGELLPIRKAALPDDA
jgi:ubiquinone/menaquinone biosynthesis C-methylase UbiE